MILFRKSFSALGSFCAIRGEADFELFCAALTTIGLYYHANKSSFWAIRVSIASQVSLPLDKVCGCVAHVTGDTAIAVKRFVVRTAKGYQIFVFFIPKIPIVNMIQLNKYR